MSAPDFRTCRSREVRPCRKGAPAGRLSASGIGPSLSGASAGRASRKSRLARAVRWSRGAAALAVALVVAACFPADDVELVPRSTLFVGVDVSGSFQQGGRYDDAMDFAAHYIHAHLAGAGGLEQPRALFVAAIGGEEPGQPQSFHPIHDFEDKSVAEIEADLRGWFPPDDNYTDFSAFFRRASALVKRQNLALTPISLVLLTDGVPDTGTRAAQAADSTRYAAIDMDPLEYLARNVTVRVLYPDPSVAVRWEREVPRNRVRIWTVDANVMEGWKEQLRTEPVAVPADQSASGEAAGGAAEGDAAVDEPVRAEILPGVELTAGAAADQPDLWRWIRDNVDFRVRRTVL